MKMYYALLNSIRTLPIYICYIFSRDKEIVESDINRWCKILNINIKNSYITLTYLLLFYKEFRNLIYYRLSKNNPIASKLLQVFYPKLDSLCIWTKEIGKGLFIQHGISTIIAAKSIGENCWINQQVTLGHKYGNEAPIIGNNVRITAGAKIIGNITVSDNCVIGANAVVVKDVDENSVVGGIPAKFIKYNC